MSAAIATTVITAMGAVCLATITYWFTKQRERDAEIRKEKLERYKAFVESLSGIIEGESSCEGQRAFATACNNFHLFAPQPAIEALHKFQEASAARNASRSKELHDKRLSELFLEIRKDLNVKPKDVPATFTVWLWASGVKSDKSTGANT